MKDRWIWDIIKNNAYIILLIWLSLYVMVKQVSARYLKGFIGISALIYLLALFEVTLWGRTIRLEPRYELSFLWEYRLAFSYTKNGIAIQSHKWMMQIINNILLFIPLGIFYGEFCQWKAKQVKWLRALAIGFIFSVLIETSQLMFKVGLFEFDDMLNNSMGMLVGCGFYKIIRRMSLR